jgi:hypothetical protein
VNAIEHRNRETRYTDWCVVVGPNMRWVEDDYEDLMRTFPEVLLGYRVHPTTVDHLLAGKYWRAPKKIVVLAGVHLHQRWSIAYREIEQYRAVHGTKIEHWFVHRTEGVWRLDRR